MSCGMEHDQHNASPPPPPANLGAQAAAKEDKSNAVVRWLLVLPGACAGYALVMFVTVLVISAEGGTGRVVQPLYAIPGNCISAILFVLAGTKLAPNHKIETAVSLAVLFSMTYAVLFTIGVMRGADGFFVGWSGFCGVISVVSAIGASISVYRNELEAKRIAEIRKKRFDSGPKKST
jgi:hypothetical protein